MSDSGPSEILVVFVYKWSVVEAILKTLIPGDVAFENN